MKRRLIIFALLAGAIIAPAQSPYHNNTFLPVVMTATSQTSTPFKLGANRDSYSAGTITLTGTALTTVTFGVLGSVNGVTYVPLAIQSCSVPGTYTLTVTATAASCYQVNLAGMLYIEYQTSGTFTATNISILLTASPVAQISRGGSGSGGGGNCTGSGLTQNYLPQTSTTPCNLTNSNIDDGATTANTLTAHEPIAVQGTAHGYIVPAGTPPSGGAGKVVYTSDATNGYAEVNENNAGIARLCTAANAQCATSIQAHAVAPDAEWAFPSGSTNTATEPDITGNGNTATASSSLTRVPSGGILLPSGGGVYLTTPIQNWTSSVFRVCYPNYGTGGTVPGYTYTGLWGTSSGTAGVNITLANSIGAPAAFAPNLFNGSFATTTATIGGACHTYAFVLGSPSHIYMDGLEVGYFAQGNVAPSATSGFYSIGAGNVLNGGFYMYGYVLYGEIFKSTTLTAAQAYAETAYVTSHSGIPPYTLNTPTTSRTSSATFLGDSITTGNGATPYPSQLSLNNTYTILNYGEGGDTICNIAYNFPYRGANAISTQAQNNVISFFAGTNDALAGNRTPADTWGCERAAVSAALLADPTAFIFVSTALDRSTFQTNKNLLNGYIRAGVPTLGSRVFLVDNAENPLLGANGAATNLTYFNADQTHPTTAGQALLGAGFSAAINMANGSSSSNPDYLTSTATLTTANNYVITNFSGIGTLTLRTCAYLTSSTVTIVNPSAFVVTVTPNGSELINGSNTSITIAASGRITLRDVLTGATTGGCSWVLQ